MTTATLVAYDETNTTAVATLTTARGIRFDLRYNRRGGLRFTWTPDDDAAPADACDPNRWVRVRIGGTDVAAYRVEQPTRRRTDTSTSSPDDAVVAVGALAAGDGAVVYPQGGIRNDYAELSATRWFGFMSDTYDDTGWEPVAEVVNDVGASYDVWDTPFSNLHDDWPDPNARYMWADRADYSNPDQQGPEFPVGSVFYRGTFTLNDAVDVAVAVSCNDEYELYLDGALLASESEPTSRDTTTILYVTLSAGTHVLAARGTNIDYLKTGKRPAWLLLSLLETVRGRLTGTDQRDELVLDAGVTDGTFTLTIDGDTTRPIAWDASPSALRDAIVDAMFPTVEFVGRRIRPADGDLEVTGSGTAADPWVVVWSGWRTYRRPHTITVDTTALVGGGLTHTTLETATPPTQLVTADPSWLVCLPYPEETPGVTIGRIVRDLVDEAVARDAGPGLNGTDVTAALDSSGASWDLEYVLGIPVGRTVERALHFLVDTGCDVDVDPAGTVRAWKRRGTDRTGTVTLRAGTGDTADGDATHVRTRPAANTLVTFHKGGMIETVGAAGPRRESHLQLGSTGTDDAAAELALAALVDLSRSRTETDLEVPDDAYDGPTVADVADTITATSYAGQLAAQRIVGLVGEVSDDTGATGWTLSLEPDLNVRRGRDRLDEADTTERIVAALELMAPGTVGGRVRTAAPVRYVDRGYSRASIPTTFVVDPIADQSSDVGDTYAAAP